MRSFITAQALVLANGAQQEISEDAIRTITADVLRASENARAAVENALAVADNLSDHAQKNFDHDFEEEDSDEPKKRELEEAIEEANSIVEELNDEAVSATDHANEAKDLMQEYAKDSARKAEEIGEQVKEVNKAVEKAYEAQAKIDFIINGPQKRVFTISPNPEDKNGLIASTPGGEAYPLEGINVKRYPSIADICRAVDAAAGGPPKYVVTSLVDDDGEVLC